MENKIQLKFCRKTVWKNQPFIYVYLMNHIF